MLGQTTAASESENTKQFVKALMQAYYFLEEGFGSAVKVAEERPNAAAEDGLAGLRREIKRQSKQHGEKLVRWLKFIMEAVEQNVSDAAIDAAAPIDESKIARKARAA